MTYETQSRKLNPYQKQYFNFDIGENVDRIIQSTGMDICTALEV